VYLLETSVSKCTVFVMQHKVYFLQIVMWLKSMGFVETYVCWFCNSNFYVTGVLISP